MQLGVWILVEVSKFFHLLLLLTCRLQLSSSISSSVRPGKQSLMKSSGSLSKREHRFWSLGARQLHSLKTPVCKLQLQYCTRHYPAAARSATLPCDAHTQQQLICAAQG